MKPQQKVLTASSKWSWFMNESAPLGGGLYFIDFNCNVIFTSNEKVVRILNHHGCRKDRSNICPSFPQAENLLVLVAAWYVTAGCVMGVFSNVLVKQKFMNNSYLACQVSGLVKIIMFTMPPQQERSNICGPWLLDGKVFWLQIINISCRCLIGCTPRPPALKSDTRDTPVLTPLVSGWFSWLQPLVPIRGTFNGIVWHSEKHASLVRRED